MDDLISRKDLMKKIAHHTVYDSMSCVTFERSTVYEMVKGDMFGLVKDAPAVAAMPRWISVEERLPDIDAEVLIYTNEGFYDVAQYSGGERFWTLERNPDCWVTALGVTHWMPLPEMPKEET